MISSLWVCFIGLATWSFFLPLCLCVWISNSVRRLRVKLILRVKFGKKFTLAERGSDFFLGHKTADQSRICIAIHTWTLPISVDKTQDIWMMKSRNGKFQKLTKIFTKKYGYNCWKEDENFNLKNHIKEYNGKERILTESDLLEYCETLMNDMDESRPQWEWILVKDVHMRNNGVETIQISRFHIGYKEGISMIKTTALLSETNPFPYAVPQNSFTLPLKYKFFSTLQFLIRCPVDLFFSVEPEEKNPSWVERKYEEDEEEPQSNVHKYLSWSDPLDFTLLKKIQLKTNIPISCLITTLIGISLQNSLVERMEHIVDQNFYRYSSPSYFKFRLLRGNIGWNLFWNNLMSRDFFFPAAPSATTCEEDCYKEKMKLERTRKKCVLNEMLVSYGPFLQSILTDFLKLCISKMKLNSELFSRETAKTHTAIICNIPLASKQIELFGETCEQIMAFAPLFANAGISFVNLSYNGTLRIGCSASSSWMTRYDLHRLMAQLSIELDYLAKEIVGERPRSRTNAFSNIPSNVYRNCLVFP